MLYVNTPLPHAVRACITIEHVVSADRVIRSDTGECVAYICRNRRGGWYVFDTDDHLLVEHSFRDASTALAWLRGDLRLKPSAASSARAVKRARSCAAIVAQKSVDKWISARRALDIRE